MNHLLSPKSWFSKNLLSKRRSRERFIKSPVYDEKKIFFHSFSVSVPVSVPVYFQTNNLFLRNKILIYCKF